MICCRGMIIIGPGVIATAGGFLLFATAGVFLPSAALAVVVAGEAGANVCSTWRQGCGSGLDPDSIGSVDPDPDSESGSGSRAKMTN